MIKAAKGVGDAVNACSENLHWILDIPSRWSKVLYFSAPIKCKQADSVEELG